WTMRNAGGNFYLSTTTTDGTATTTTSALTILNGGNVGIGTTEPIYKLDMGGGSNSYLNSIRIGGALIGGHSGTDYDYIGWNIAPASVGGTYTYSMPNQNAAGSIIKFGAGGFQFLTAPSGTGGDSATLTSRMNMTAGGDLAIGTTATASWRVHIEKSSDTVVGSGTFWNYDGGGGLFIRNPSNTINATAGIGFALGTANTSGAGIAAIEESTTLGALGFFTGGSGTSNSFPERMRITSGGNVGIGTTTPWGLLSVNPNGIGNGPEFVVGSSTTTHLVVTNNGNVGIGTTGPIYKLDVAGAASRFTGSAVSGEDDPVIRVWNPVDDDNVRGLVRFYRKAAETNVGLISASNTTTSYVTSSDARLKENINQTLLGLDVLSKIQVRDYNFIADPTSRVQGFIAQELFKVYPQAVYVPENEEDYWGIDYGKLTPLLVKGIQELSIRTAGLSSATTTPSLIIMDNGNVGVGTSTPASKFHVFSNITSGGVAVFSDANASCTIDPTNASMSCTSDQSLKKDIETLNASTTLEKIMALRPVSYRWNGEGDSWEGQTFPKHQGFIAQEVEAIFPEFVTTSADGKKSIAYSNFIPAMVQAIQTINSKVNAIDTRLTNLETLIASTPTTAGGLTFTQIMEEFVNQFEIIGVKFMNGIAYFKNIFTDELTVGTSVKPSGITLYDEVTNEPYCLKMKNGAMVSLAGECTNAVATTTPDTATTTPDAVPQTTDTSSPVISIISDNPAVVTVGTHYSDMGATVTDMGVNSLDLTGPLVRNDNLGLHYTVDGISLNEVSIDTSTSTIHTVVYSVVDGSGNWGYATRTVEVITQ
ncbi:MAG: tail fiber domain-containing protein, partial [Candidatus Paceibacterota bacterium]